MATTMTNDPLVGYLKDQKTGKRSVSHAHGIFCNYTISLLTVTSLEKK